MMQTMRRDTHLVKKVVGRFGDFNARPGPVIRKTGARALIDNGFLVWLSEKPSIMTVHAWLHN